MIGKILWWDQERGYGVISSENGERVYFDLSVVATHDAHLIKRHVSVRFDYSKDIKNCKAATSVHYSGQRGKQKKRIKDSNQTMENTA